MNNNHWVRVALVAALLAALLAGCAAGGAEPTGESDSVAAQPTGETADEAAEGGDAEGEADPVKLSFAFWGNDTHKAMYESMIADFKTAYANVDVEIMTIPAADYQQKLSVMMATKTAPDVFWLMERAIPQFMNADQLADLSALRDDPEYRFDDFYPSTLTLFQKEGKQHGIPFSTPPNMIYYNKTLFKEKGLKTPSELYAEGKWTYDEMIKAAQALSDPANGVYGINFIRPNGWGTAWIESMITVLRAQGADYFADDMKRFTLNTPEGEQALQLFSDLMFKLNVHPKPGDQTTFETGKIAMQQELFSYMGKAKAVTDFEWDIAPMPEGKAGRGTILGYAGYAMSNFTEHPEEALAFIRFVSNPENMQVSSQYFVPSRKSVLESEQFLTQGPSPESVKSAVLEQMAEAKVRPASERFQQIDETMKRDMDALFTQSMPVADMIRLMEQNVAPYLK